MKKCAGTPLIQALNEYISDGRTIMHMPGHKGGKAFNEDFKNNAILYDLTELPGLDNFHEPDGVIQKSMKACSKAFGSLKSYYLVNGSTSGIHAMLLSTLKKGDKLLVDRNCHISVINGLILFGIEPVFVMPEYSKSFNMLLPAGTDAWEKAISDNPDVKGAFVTTPDYYGFCQPLYQLSNLLHDKGKLLLVDEAHGAHFVFSPKLPKTALEQGADLCVQSFHKTLPALTQTAVLHIGSKRIDPKKVQRVVSMLTTTSPSYTIMASADYARDFTERTGSEMYDKLIDLLSKLKNELAEMKNLRVVPDNISGFKRDPTRIVIDTSYCNISGYELYEQLFNDYGISAEMSDRYHVVFILTMADNIDDIKSLKNALIHVDKICMRTTEKSCLSIPFSSNKCSIPDLFDYLDFSGEIPLEHAQGYVSAGMVTPYPPGIPILCPGEEITKEHIQYLNNISGSYIRGFVTDGTNNKLVKVLKQNED